MKVSIVLSTYNGSNYIVELLDSLKNQSYKIDEVIISDDCSTDNTVDLIEEYISTYNLKNWALQKNEENVGWKRNFRKLINTATGDLIFPCDQDDVWIKNKVEKMVRIMDANLNIEVLASNPILFKNEVPYNVLENNDIENTRKVELKDFYYVTKPGCTFCVRRTLLNGLIDYWDDEFPHDAFLWRISALKGSLYILDSNTIFYRRHNETATGREEKNYENRVNVVNYYIDFLMMLKKFLENNKKTPLCHKGIREIDDYISWARHRKSLLERFNIGDALFLLSRINHYWCIKSYIGDIYVSIRH